MIGHFSKFGLFWSSCSTGFGLFKGGLSERVGRSLWLRRTEWARPAVGAGRVAA